MLPDAMGVWIVLLGAVAGSFVTAMSDRLCRQKPVLYARSSCNSCGHVLQASDLVPILSYIGLKGKCRHCGAAIPKAAFFGEWAGLAAGLFAVWINSDPVLQFLGAVFLWLLVGLFQSDARCYRLPDAFTLPLLAVGLALGSLQFGFVQSGLAAVVGFGSFWIVAVVYRSVRGRDGLGMGDAKLVAGLAAAVGLTALPMLTLLAAISALTHALFMQLGGARLNATTKIAFGCHLALAGAFVWGTTTVLPGWPV